MIAEKLRKAVRIAALSGNLTRDLQVHSSSPWLTREIRDVITGHKGGGTPSKNESRYWGGDIAWASIKDIKSSTLKQTQDAITEKGLQESSSNLIPIDSVIVGMRMGVGKVCVNKISVAINQDLRALFPDASILPEYLMLAISGLKFQTSGATVQGIKLKQLLDAEISIPPIDEQKTIIERLKVLDSLIDRLAELEREREDLDRKFAIELRSSWLRAGVSGNLLQFCAENVTDFLAKSQQLKREYDATSSTRQASLQKDPKVVPPFPIPPSWVWCRIGEIISLVNGRAYKKHEMLERGKWPLLRVGNLFTRNKWYYSDLELSEEKYCDRGDLLYAWSASFGPFIWDGPRSIFHYHIWNVQYFGLDRDYIYYALMEDALRVRDSTTGSTMVHVSMKNMVERILPIPGPDEQRQIAKTLSLGLSIVDKISHLASRQ